MRPKSLIVGVFLNGARSAKVRRAAPADADVHRCLSARKHYPVPALGRKA